MLRNKAILGEKSKIPSAIYIFGHGKKQNLFF
jgi:hypothetical protein